MSVLNVKNLNPSQVSKKWSLPVGVKKKPLYSHALIGKINTATVHLIFSLMRHVSTVFHQQWADEIWVTEEF